jgi:uncharacterized cupredoxin-like copper-binding protein
MRRRRRASVLLAAAVLVAGATLAGAAIRQVREVTVVLREYSFTPRAIVLRTGTPVKLVLVNEGARDHEFQVYSVPRISPRDWSAYVMAHTYFTNMGEIDVALPGQAEVGTTALFKVHVAPGARVTIWFTPRVKGVFEVASHDPGRLEKGLRGTLAVK